MIDLYNLIQEPLSKLKLDIPVVCYNNLKGIVADISGEDYFKLKGDRFGGWHHKRIIKEIYDTEKFQVNKDGIQILNEGGEVVKTL